MNNFIRTCKYIQKYIYLYIYIYIYIYIYVHICIFINAYICLYICLHIFLCTYMHIYIHMYIHIHTFVYMTTSLSFLLQEKRWDYVVLQDNSSVPGTQNLKVRVAVRVAAHIALCVSPQ